MKKQKNLGILFIILSAFSFAWMSTFVRLAGDLPSVQKSFFRNIVAVFVALITLLRSKEKVKMGEGNLKYLILRATFGTIGILGNFYAIDHLVLSDANMLNKMSPFFVILFSYLILKEELTIQQGLFVVGAFLGSLFIIKPTFANANLTASLAGLLGGICAGAAGGAIEAKGDKSTTQTGVYKNANGMYEFSVFTASAAQHTIESIDKMINVVDSKRAELGALQNRMESTIRNQENVSENVSDARSRIRDADYAEEAANLSAQNIVQQAATTVLTQANSRPQIALSLLGS